jgi:SAM-dependent methyltransferase
MGGVVEAREIAAVYDAVADRYAARFVDELDNKPFDRRQLDSLAKLARGRGPICDAGCGPGHVAAYLRRQGAEAFGGDLSEGMLREARRRFPDIDFQRQDLLALSLPDGSLGGVAAMYAIVNFTLDQAETAFRGFHRALTPGGVALVAFHVGDERNRVEEFLGVPVAADFAFFQPNDIADRLEAAGLAVEEVAVRDPYPEIEYPSRRAYLLARRPE